MQTKTQLLRNCTIVEPDRDAMNAIVRHLEPLNLRLFTVDSAEEALDSGSFQADFLISNLHLPGVSGLELIEALQDRGNFPQTVLIADQPTFSEGRAAWKLGVTEFLSKPFDLEDLLGTVQSFAELLDNPTELPTSLELTTAATLSGAKQLVRESIAFAMRHGAGPAARARLGSAVSEIADNARLHAYKDDSGDVHLKIRIIGGDELRVQISDNGCGFDAIQERLDSIASPLSPSAPMPQGFMRVSALVEGLKLQSSPEGSTVELIVAFGIAAFEEEFGNDFSELDYFDTATAKRVLRELRQETAGSLLSIPPSLAVVLGRLLAGSTGTQVAHSTLWS